MREVLSVESVRKQIKVCENEINHLTNIKKVPNSKKTHYFLELSHKWLMAYNNLDKMSFHLSSEEYKKHLGKLYILRDKMIEYAILGR